MNRKRILAIGKLVLLFGTKLAVILGLVSGGRDTGNQEFESRHVTEHVRLAAAALRAAGLGPL